MGALLYLPGFALAPLWERRSEVWAGHVGRLGLGAGIWCLLLIIFATLQILGPASIWSATGAMVIISAGADNKYQCGITGSTDPSLAVTANFDGFAPDAINKGDDVYYIFNAGIQ